MSVKYRAEDKPKEVFPMPDIFDFYTAVFYVVAVGAMVTILVWSEGEEGRERTEK